MSGLSDMQISYGLRQQETEKVTGLCPLNPFYYGES